MAVAAPKKGYRGRPQKIKTMEMKEQEKFEVTLFNGAPLAVTPPNFIELEITETDPGLKGDTAQGGSKPATLSTGAVVRVPLFLSEGEV